MITVFKRRCSLYTARNLARQAPKFPIELEITALPSSKSLLRHPLRSMAQRSPLRLVSTSTRWLKEQGPRYPCLLRRYESDLANNQLSKDAPSPPSSPLLGSHSSLSAPGPTEEIIKSFNPAEQARKRKALLGRELPPSRLVHRPTDPHIRFNSHL